MITEYVAASPGYHVHGHFPGIRSTCVHSCAHGLVSLYAQPGIPLPDALSRQTFGVLAAALQPERDGDQAWAGAVPDRSSSASDVTCRWLPMLSW
jgi:hypothetical protein